MTSTIASSPAQSPVSTPRSPSRRRRRRRRPGSGEGWAAAVLLAPDVLGLAVIYVGPILYTVYLSFFQWNGISPDRTYVGLDNFRFLLDDPTWRKSLVVSVLYVAMYVPLVTGGALFLAVLLAQKLRGSALFRTVYFLPMAVPVVVAAIVAQFVFHPSYGFVNYLLGLVGLPAQPWLSSPNQALVVVVIVSAWKQVGYFMIIFLAALLAVPKDLLEAAEMDGAGGVRRFRSITLPMIWPTTLFVIVMTTILALQDFDQIFVLTRGGPNYGTYVQVYYIYDQMLSFLRMGTASAASVVLFLIIMLISLAQIRLFRRGFDEQ
jgi:ABC-type sugar transport system permease subunit